MNIIELDSDQELTVQTCLDGMIEDVKAQIFPNRLEAADASESEVANEMHADMDRAIAKALLKTLVAEHI